MKNIKFRAWDVLEDMMRYGVSVHENSLIIEIDTDNSELTEYVPHLNEKWFKVMQYSGLKDKNGTEIYEKDIVNEDGQYAVCCWIDEVAAYAFVPVELYPTNDFATIFEHHALDTFFRNDIPSSFVQVIGNVFENENLLKEES